MISYHRFTLNNGLTVLVNEDPSTPLVAFNMLYRVGARDEDPERTGFAHLFEHLMFGGSKHVEAFDTPLQMAGGNSNAFTSNDLTNYYITLPRKNIETAFWLESDRMMELTFSGKSLEVQRHVVIEEYKQRYLNQPYGDVWLLLRPLAYIVHPYRWATIGKEIRHIEEATLDEVKHFFFSHYAPNNAILSLSGNITLPEVKSLSEKWFGPIPSRQIAQRKIAVEPAQKEKRTLEVTRSVPASSIYLAFHMGGRLSGEYFCADLITDLLAGGPSSRFQQHLIREKQLFSQMDAFITGSIDPGLLVITGNLNPGITMEQAEEAIFQEITQIREGHFTGEELTAMKNKAESAWIYSRMHVLNKAMNLSFFEMIGDADQINNELENYRSVSRSALILCTEQLFRKTNCSILYYHQNSNHTLANRKGHK